MRRLLFLLVLACSASSAVAQPSTTAPQTPAPQAPPPEPEYPVVRVGVLSYLQYASELENRDDFNSFDITRAYLNINAQVAKNLRFRFTPDIRRVTDGSLAGSLTVRVKYGFLQVDNVLTPRSWIRAGLSQTPWLDFEEAVNRYRVQGTMFSEREALIPGSADFGVGYFTPLPGNYGEVHAGVYNGEGFTQAEANKYKSFQGRLTIRPLPKGGLAQFFRISGFYSAGWYAADRPRRVGIVMAHYEHKYLVATVQRVDATENPSALTPRDIARSGWSVFIEPRQGTAGWAGIARVESFDPDTSFSDDSHRRVIGGGAYWFVWPRARLGLVATNEQIHYDSAALRPTENRILLQTHVEF
jgi:hypothetical protein